MAEWSARVERTWASGWKKAHPSQVRDAASRREESLQGCPKAKPTRPEVSIHPPGFPWVPCIWKGGIHPRGAHRPCWILVLRGNGARQGSI
jgi:hypothetical protein